jgi:3-hydroxyisobutyrate dehydrogenase-like beta-hydroxyacid dehydrogenase
MSEKIAFLGLGNLGTPIAESLLEAGYELVVWNRTKSKAEPLIKLGATVVEDPVEAITTGGLVFSVLADDAAVEEIFQWNLSKSSEKMGYTCQ